MGINVGSGHQHQGILHSEYNHVARINATFRGHDISCKGSYGCRGNDFTLKRILEFWGIVHALGPIEITLYNLVCPNADEGPTSSKISALAHTKLQRGACLLLRLGIMHIYTVYTVSIHMQHQTNASVGLLLKRNSAIDGCDQGTHPPYYVEVRTYLKTV